MTTNKEIILERLTAIERAVKELRLAVQNSPVEPVAEPYFYKYPVTDLLLDGVKNPNRFYNLCEEHMVSTIGQLINIGANLVKRWRGVSPTMLTIITRELRDRYNAIW